MNSNDNLMNLLPAFRQCDNYADRLTFWEINGLNDSLYYNALDYCPTEENPYLPGYFLNQLWQCRTWEGVKALPVLTLAPFTSDEARQFVEWATRIRPGMRDAPQAADAQISRLQQEYAGIDFGHLQDELLNQYRQASLLWLTGRLHENYAISKNALSLAGIDPQSFGLLMNEQAEKRAVDLASHIPLGKVEMNWKAVDTYLFAKAKYEFAVFLEHFTPGNVAPDTSTPSASDEPTRERKHRPATIARDQEIKDLVENFMTMEGKARSEAMQLTADKKKVSLDTVERAFGFRKR